MDFSLLASTFITVFLADDDTVNLSQRLQNLARPAGNPTSSEVLR